MTKRRQFIIWLLVCIAIAVLVVVGARATNPGLFGMGSTAAGGAAPIDPGVIFSEDWDVVGSVAGPTNMWTAYGNSIIDDSSGTNQWTGHQSWFVDGSANSSEPDSGEQYDFSAALADPSCGRFSFILKSETPNFDDFRYLMGNSTSPASLVAWWFEFFKTGATTQIEANVFGGSGVGVVIPVDVWHEVDWQFSSSAGTLDWQLNGSAQTQASGNTGRTDRYLHLYTSTLGEGFIDGVSIYTNTAAYPLGASTQDFIFVEDFDDDFNGDGYEATWTEADTDNKVNGFDGTRFVTGTNSLSILPAAAGTNHYTSFDYGASSGIQDYYWRLYVYIPSGQSTEDGWILSSNDGVVDPDQVDATGVLMNNAGTGRIGFANPGVSGNIVLGTNHWVLLEGHYTTGVFKINGTEVTNLVDDTTPKSLRYMVMGDDVDSGDNAQWYADAFAISTNGWIGPVSPDYATAAYGCVAFWDMTVNGASNEPDLISTNDLDKVGTTSTPTDSDVPYGYVGTAIVLDAPTDFDELEIEYTNQSVELQSCGVGQDAVFTISMWVQPTNIGAWSTFPLWGKGGDDNATNYSWQIALDSADGVAGDADILFRFSTNKTSWTTAVSSPSEVLSEGVWSHVAAVYDDSNAIIYHNGLPVITSAYSLGTATGVNNEFGSIQNWVRYDGKYDETGLWTNALTDAQIKNIHDFGIQGRKGR